MNCDIGLGSWYNLRCWAVVKALLVWILLTLHMEVIGLLSRAHPTGIGSVSVHLFRAGNRNETTAGFEPWLSQVWGKWGKNQSEAENRSAVESLGMGKGDKLSLCSTAIRKEGKSCYTSPISELGKQIPVITVTVILPSLKKNKPTAFPWREKDIKKEGEEAERVSREKAFLRCLCDFCQRRERCLSSSQMSSSSRPCGNKGSPSTSRQGVHLCFPLDSDKFLFGFISVSWSSFTSY